MVGVRSVRYLSAIAGLTLLVATLIGFASPASAADVACGTSGTPTVTSMHGTAKPFYYTDSTLNSGWAGWKMATTDANIVPYLWAKLLPITSTDLKLSYPGVAAGQDGPTFPVRGADTAAGYPLGYAYLTDATAAASAAAQNFRVEFWVGDPSLSGSTKLCYFDNSFASVAQVNVTGSMKPNPPVADYFGAAGPVLGRTFTVTVTGTTGNISNNGPDPALFSNIPSAASNWPAANYQLIKSYTTFTGGVPATMDGLLRQNFSTTPNNANFTTVYTYFVRGLQASTISSSARYMAAIGGGIQESNVSSSPLSIPIATNPASGGGLTQTLTSSTNWNASPKRVTYTWTLTNTTAGPICVDTALAVPAGTWTFVGSPTSPTKNDGTFVTPTYWGPPGAPSASVTAGSVTFPNFCVPAKVGATNGKTTITFAFDFTSSSLSLTLDTSIGTTPVSNAASGTATLSLHVNSNAPYSENYDGVAVAVAQFNPTTSAWGPFTYKTGTTDAAGNWDGGPIDPNATYRVKLTQPCDSQTSVDQTDLSVLTGAQTPTYSLAATVPCPPVLSYTAGSDTMSWTAPNDGGSTVQYFTMHYNTPARLGAIPALPWGIFARYWPANSLSVPFGTYASSGCPGRGIPAYVTAPQCGRGIGPVAFATPYSWRVAARNSLSSAGILNPTMGAGWSMWSNTLPISRGSATMQAFRPIAVGASRTVGAPDQSGLMSKPVVKPKPVVKGR